MKKVSTRRLVKMLFVVAMLGLLVFLNPRGFFNPIRVVLTKMAYPFEKVSYAASYKFNQWSDFLISIGQLKHENARLLNENRELLAENARFHEVERENDFLRQQLEILPKDRFELQQAFIISQDPHGLGNYIDIDKGSDDGIEEGMAVTISKGVMVGRVEKTLSDRSVVMLITNPKSAINVVDSKTGTKGLVRGEYGLGIIADSILQTDSISVGDEMVTSGMGSNTPKGLLVGTVQEIRPSPDHLFSQAIISSPADISKLEMVFVLKKSK